MKSIFLNLMDDPILIKGIWKGGKGKKGDHNFAFIFSKAGIFDFFLPFLTWVILRAWQLTASHGVYLHKISQASFNANQQQKIGNPLNHRIRKRRRNFDLQKTSKILIEWQRLVSEPNICLKIH